MDMNTDIIESELICSLIYISQDPMHNACGRKR